MECHQDRRAKTSRNLHRQAAGIGSENRANAPSTGSQDQQQVAEVPSTQNRFSEVRPAPISM
jgi:hypothetical protein